MKKLSFALFLTALAVSSILVQGDSPKGGGQTNNLDRWSQPRQMHFHDEPLTTILKLYGLCSRRTVLHPTLPATTFTFDAEVKDDAAVVTLLNGKLSEKKIVTVLDGDKFVRVLPNSWKDTAPIRAFPINSSTAGTNNNSTGPNTIPVGGIDLPQIPIAQVVAVYCALAGAKPFELSDYPDLPSGLVSLTTSTQVTREEAIYALDTLFYWDGFKLVPSTDNKLKIVKVSGH